MAALSELERLNLAMKAVLAEHRYEDIELEQAVPLWKLAILLLWVVLLEGNSGTATWWLRGSAIAVVVSGVAARMFYRKWLPAWTIAFCAFQFLVFLLRPPEEFPYRVLLNLIFSVWFVIAFLTDGDFITRVNNEVLSEDLEKAHQWYQVLNDSFGHPSTIQFKSRNSWRGRRSFRILDAERYWVVGSSQTGNEVWLPDDYRVYARHELQVRHGNDGQLELVMGSAKVIPCSLDDWARKRLEQTIRGTSAAKTLL